jgi:hypothetical protein
VNRRGRTLVGSVLMPRRDVEWWVPRHACLRAGLRIVLSPFFVGTCVCGRAGAHPNALDRGEILWFAAPPRLQAPSSARRAAVSANWPSSRVCLVGIGARTRGGNQVQRTPARGRAATGAVTAGESSRRGSASRT